MSICWAALFLHEQLTWPTILGGIVVIGCAGIAVRARLGQTASAGKN
jgi:drug/metabolite transporter (DMT)-like permease